MENIILYEKWTMVDMDPLSQTGVFSFSELASGDSYAGFTPNRENMTRIKKILKVSK